MKLWNLAKQFTLPTTFHGRLGGSFLNHQYLVCACAPNIERRHAAARPTIATLDKDASGNFLSRLHALGDLAPPRRSTARHVRALRQHHAEELLGDGRSVR